MKERILHVNKLNLEGGKLTLFFKSKRIQKLLKNAGLFAVANMMSKVAALVIVPLCTYYMTTEEYGIVDTVITTVNLLLPLVSLGIYEAVLRYGMKDNVNQKQILSNAFFIIFFSGILLFALFPFLCKVKIIGDYYLIFCIILILEEIVTTLAAFAKAIDKVKLSVIIGVTRTFVLFAGVMIFVVGLGLGVKGYLYGIVLSLICALIGYVFSMNLFRYLTIVLDFSLIKKMLKYSVPLMINGMLWWIMQSSDKYMLIAFEGLDANGIYSVANKISSIINMVHAIFFQAWQLSAIEEYKNDDVSKYYSKIINKYSQAVFIGTIGIVLFTKPIYTWFFATEFKIAWKYSYFLVLSMVLYSFSSFYGANYTVVEDTKGALKTSMIGAITNFALNLVMIPLFGVQGAAITTFVAYLVLWVIRCIDTRKYVKIDINVKYIVTNMGGLVIASAFILTEIIIFEISAAVILLALLGLNIVAFFKKA